MRFSLYKYNISTQNTNYINQVLMPQVIIPAAVRASGLPRQSLQQPSISGQGSKTLPIYSCKPSSRKSAGAFKLFKLRKPRKPVPQTTTLEDAIGQALSHHTRVYKLKNILPVIDVDENKSLKSITEPPFNYFDPNLAPLYLHQNQTTISGTEFQHEKWEKIDILPPEQHDKIVQNRPSKNMEIVQSDPENSEQFQYQEAPTHEGDPFIIVKKVDIKKAKLRKVLGNIVPLSKVTKKVKEGNLIEEKIKSMTQINSLMSKQNQTPNCGRGKEEGLLAETQKSEHSRPEDFGDSVREGEREGIECIKRLTGHLTESIGAYNFSLNKDENDCDCLTPVKKVHKLQYEQ